MKRHHIPLLLLVLCVLGLAVSSPSASGAPRDIAQPAGTETFIQIFKSEEVLEVWQKVPGDDRFELVKSHPICRYSGELGPKLKEGDRQAPEGFYSVGASALNPNSSYHLSFNLGFPNAYDRAHGRTGSYLMVHGACVSIGCYAMTDGGIEDIYAAVEASLRDGQSDVAVHIYPFRMTPEALELRAEHKWINFWQELKPAYDYFLETGLPAQIRVEGQSYRVTPA